MSNKIQHSIFDLSVRSRLFAGFFVVMVPVIIILLIFIFKISSIQKTADHLLTVSLPTLSAGSVLDAQINDAQAALYDYVITRNEKSKTNFDFAWIDIQNSKNIMDELAPKWGDKVFAKSWKELKALYVPLQEAQQKMLDLVKSNAAPTAITQFIEQELRPKRYVMIDMLDGQRSPTTKLREGGMMNEEEQFLNQATRSFYDSINTLKDLGYFLLIATVVLATIIPYITARAIVNPLNKAKEAAKDIASGERNVDLSTNSSNEIGQLLTSLDEMQTAIKSNEDNIRANEAKTQGFLDKILSTGERYSTHSSKLASGDLTMSLDIDKEDILAKLGEDLNSLMESMSSTAHKILDSSNNIFTALEEVRSLANSQSAGVTEQASSIQEITSSLEEIDKSSKQTMEKAQTLGQVAKQTREKGTLGIQSVEKSIEGMRVLHDKVQAISKSILDLSTQTQQVGEITAVVNTLAQQSKMLALNASIEAAKAGEAGKGFAVVAIEVKNLAEQSEQSTAQVQKILEDIRRGAEKSVLVTEEGTKGVSESSRLIQDASEVIHSLNNMISDASIASQQIEASIRQETISIEQITAGMTEINQVTSSFVSGVREIEKAINYLTEIAEKLKEYVSIYKLKAKN